MFKILVVIYFLLVISTKANREKRDEIYPSEVGEGFPVKLLNYKPGDEVFMKCKDHDATSNMHEHRWKFFPCDDCNKMKATHIEWRLLPQHKKRLHFKSVSPADSGRYLCTVNDNTIASYQLKVSRTQNLNQEYKFIGRAPEIVDIEKNDDIRPNGIVAVKCKIISPIAPRIWWLKQCEEAQKCDLNYDGKFYYKINVTYDMQREENVYVSKLHLRNFTHRDDGLYVCVTMTELGKDYRTFTLTLPPSVADDEGERQTSNLSYLFLVPIAFILIPICIDCLGKRIGIKKSKQEVMLLEVVTPTTPRIYNS